MARDKAFLKAEQKIETARRSEATELDLRSMEITELPGSLGQLKRLQSLNISHNRLTALPGSLGQLKQLQSLDLSGNQLTALPETLEQLTKLQSLNLSHNQLTTLPGSLGQLKQLQSLDLSGNQLTALPETLEQLTKLQSLNLSDNHLTLLPDSFGILTQLRSLNLSNNQLTVLPESLSKLIQLHSLNLFSNLLTVLPKSLGPLWQLQNLNLSRNKLAELPEWLGLCWQLSSLNLSGNQLTILPESLEGLKQLQSLNLTNNQLMALPESLGQLTQLKSLQLYFNKLTDLPSSIAQFIEFLNIDQNPLNPELSAAYEQGLDAVKAYLRAKAAAQITLNEAKLILVGEGEVGKTCLMDALLDKPWQEHDTTHGIEIKPVTITDPDSQKEITLNGWDFGGQRVYHPTHQLFFSAPAVYLVVWKPREGPQQGFVKEWIQLIKRREPDAKILVVATHGGPQQRQPDIDRQELWDLFGRDTVLDFFHIESKPDENGERRGIEDIKHAIAHVASTLPEMGRSVPKRWQDVRDALAQSSAAYLPLERVLALCRENSMDEEEARLFVIIEHRLGHLIHYQHDPILHDLVVLKPNWLATAISFVLDDEETRRAHGLVSFSRLSQLWNDPTRPADSRYPASLHLIFLRLMERFDLSYRVAGLTPKNNSDHVSLIAQLVPDNRPDPIPGWAAETASEDSRQVQICRIVEKGQSAKAEGLFYQLIVRLHKYSLGRINYNDSVHWQRGLVLDDGYNGRALLENIGNDVRITVRAPYPERFLAMLTGEVKYLVESFWEGLRCEVMVPCIDPCGKNAPGMGLFEVDKLITFRRQGMNSFPCMVSGCNQMQNIDSLLRNAPAIRPQTAEALFADFADVKSELFSVHQLLVHYGDKTLTRFDRLDARTRRILSKVDDAYAGLIQALTDEAKEGPRLFSLVPVDRSKFNLKEWTSARFGLILWCEHSRLPLPLLNGKNNRHGIYEFDLTREWFENVTPYLKVLSSTLSLVLPIASSGVKLALDEATYKSLENYLDFGKEVIDASLNGSEKIGDWLGEGTSSDIELGAGIRSQGAKLREFHALLKSLDPTNKYGGLVRVMNKRQEFLWVHPMFEKEY